MPLDAERRPDPDALLAETRLSHRGRLKIFFGAVAGVGKTYAMLAEARRLRAQGLDVVVGVAETHGRSETAELLEGLEQLPLRRIDYRGRRLREFDLDGALARHPAVVLVDELAHSNVAGARHPKRWQDVEELLDAGIDVFTTINVQHLESLNDIVGSITGIQVRETVPDRIFEDADEIVLVDLPPEDLLQRLKEGKVYLAGQAERAIEHFFRKGNLIALRELALRRTADQVDEEMRSYRSASDNEQVWHTKDTLLVCVGPEGGSDKVVRTAARLAARLGCPWHAVFVETPRLHRLPEGQRRAILKTLKLAQDLGASTATLSDPDEAIAVLDYARQHNLGKIVIGRRSEPRFWQRPGRFAERLGRLGPDLDLVVVAVDSPEALPEVDETRDPRPFEEKWQVQIRGCLAALLLGAGLTALARPLVAFFDPANIVMLYLLGVVFVAVRYGRLPAIVAAITNVATFDFFFVLPHFSFSVSDMQYLVTFGVMLIVGILIGHLTSGMRYQARVANYREQRSRNLYEMAKALSGAVSAEQIADTAAEFVARSFNAKARILLPDEHHQLVLAGQHAERLALDLAVAQWCFDKREPAGAGSHTLPAIAQRLQPLVTPRGIFGVLALEPSSLRLLMIPEQQRLLETYAVLIAIALERLHLAREAEASRLQVESEHLRNALLAALSHDLRTPLTVLFGQAEMLTLALEAARSPHAGRADEIRQQVLATSRLVNNMLDMARLQMSDFALRKDWQSLEEIVGSALHGLEVPLAGHEVQLTLPPDLPLLHCDGVMLERVLVNLLENACKYAGEAAPIGIRAKAEGDHMRLEVWDGGRGLPAGQERAIFDKFARGEVEAGIPGVGLGLAICRAIVEAHGGRIWAENRPEGGARFQFTLPLATLPPLDDEMVDTP